MLFSECYSDYYTAATLEWKHLLKQDKYKDLIISGLKSTVKENQIKVYGFAVLKFDNVTIHPIYLSILII